MERSSIITKISKSIRVRNGSCPEGHSLMSAEKQFNGEWSIGVRVRHKGFSGMLYLNPFYGSFDYECDIPLKRGEVVDITCPECGISLAVETICALCNIPMFAIHLPDGGQVEACPKVGCHNHSLTIVDLDAQLDRMYIDETKVMM